MSARSGRISIVLAAAIWLAAAPAVFAEFITSPRGGVVVGNRGVGSISVIDVATNMVNTVNLPAGTATADPMYIVFSPLNSTVFVGDRANNRIVAFNGHTFQPLPTTMPAGPGIFHMIGNLAQNQLWVVNDGAGTTNRTITVHDMLTFQTLATIPIPASLIAQGGTPHDIIVDPVARQAYVTVNGIAGANNDVVLRFSTDTFQSTGTITSGDANHVFLNPNNNFLYVTSEGGDRVDVFNRTTLNLLTSIPVFNAHGVDSTADGRTLYVSSFPSANPAAPGLLTVINTQSNTVLGTVPTPALGAGPHNLAVSVDDSRLYISHTGSNFVSFYNIGANGIPVFAGQTTTAAGANAFGISAVPQVAVPAPPALLLLLSAAPLAGAAAWWRRRRT